MNLRNDFLSMAVETEEVYVPPLERTVRVRGLSGIDRGKVERTMMQLPKIRAGQSTDDVEVGIDLASMRPMLVCYCVVDDDGQRVFADDDLPQIGELDAKVIDPIFDVAMRLSALRNEDRNGIEKAMVTDPLPGSPTT